MVRGLTLVLVAWHVAALAGGVPPEIERARRHLRDIEGNLDVDLDCCGIWYASDDDLQKIRFARRYGHRADVRQAVGNSYEADCTDVGDLPSGPPQPPNYSDLRNRWSDAVARGDLSASDRWCRELIKFFEKDVVARLLADAEKTDDVISKTLLRNLAETSSLRHDQALLMAAHFSLTANQTPLGKRVLSPEQFRQQQAMHQQILALTGRLAERRSPHGR